MSQAELKTLAKLAKNGWKQLATLEDPDDADSIREILVSILEGIDQIEESAAE